MRYLTALAFTALLGWALAAGSGVAVAWHGAASAELRLSWSARPERLEHCRRLSDAELAERPAHMRQRVECEGRSATYLLTVQVDGTTVDSAVVTGAGMRRDRPIYLLRDYDVAPGDREVRVTFVRREDAPSEAPEAVADTATAGTGGRPPNDRDAREAMERAGRRMAALPARLDLTRTVTFRSGQAVLVTVEGGSFVVQTP